MTRVLHFPVGHIDQTTGLSVVMLPEQAQVLDILSVDRGPRGVVINLIVIERVYPSIMAPRKFAFVRPGQEFLGSSTMTYVGMLTIISAGRIFHVFEFADAPDAAFVESMKEKESEARGEKPNKPTLEIASE